MNNVDKKKSTTEQKKPLIAAFFSIKYDKKNSISNMYRLFELADKLLFRTNNKRNNRLVLVLESIYSFYIHKKRRRHPPAFVLLSEIRIQDRLSANLILRDVHT